MSNSNTGPLKLTKKHKAPQIPSAISHASLLAKSQLHAKRSLEASAAGFNDLCQLWAATALELLAKAQLAQIHPSLVVEPDNPNSLLEANGISTGTVIRTVSAAVAYARLKHTVPQFSTPVHDECKKLAERRNAELHSGEAACAAMPKEAWVGNFWNAADLILSSMNMELKDWLGADSTAPLTLLKEYRQAQMMAAKQRVKDHAALFNAKGLGKMKLEKLLLETESLDSDKYIGKFHYLYVKYWPHKCPSCSMFGIAAGDQEWEELAEDQSSADFGYEIIESGYKPSEFYCPTCELLLVGDIAVAAVGIDDELVEQCEQAIEFEPDYGND